MSTSDLHVSAGAKARIRGAAARGALTHALLFTGPGDRLAAAQYAAQALECTASHDRPCGQCSGCRKVLAGIHPDVTVVEDGEHKMISVGTVRAARADAYIRPNEGACKVYLFPDCALLTEQDQNVLLKIVEEGPPYAAFCFCAENSAAVLPTLRSRCAELKLQPETGGQNEETLDAPAQALCQAVGTGRPANVAGALARLEKQRLTREDLQAMLEQTQGCFVAALLSIFGQLPQGGRGETASFLAKNLTKMQMLHTIELLQRYRQECTYNVSPGQVLGALAVEWEGIL